MWNHIYYELLQQARFTILPDDILAEELLPVTVELCNAGTVPMCNVFLGTPTPWLIAIEDNNTSEISTELKEKSGIREFNDGLFLFFLIDH